MRCPPFISFRCRETSCHREGRNSSASSLQFGSVNHLFDPEGREKRGRLSVLNRLSVAGAILQRMYEFGIIRIAICRRGGRYIIKESKNETYCDKRYFLEMTRRGATSISSKQTTPSAAPIHGGSPNERHVFIRKNLLGGLHLKQSFVFVHPH